MIIYSRPKKKTAHAAPPLPPPFTIRELFVFETTPKNSICTGWSRVRVRSDSANRLALHSAHDRNTCALLLCHIRKSSPVTSTVEFWTPNFGLQKRPLSTKSPRHTRRPWQARHADSSPERLYCLQVGQTRRNRSGRLAARRVGCDRNRLVLLPSGACGPKRTKCCDQSDFLAFAAGLKASFLKYYIQLLKD